MPGLFRLFQTQQGLFDGLVGPFEVLEAKLVDLGGEVRFMDEQVNLEAVRAWRQGDLADIGIGRARCGLRPRRIIDYW